jgi:hypothetical protein
LIHSGACFLSKTKRNKDDKEQKEREIKKKMKTEKGGKLAARISSGLCSLLHKRSSTTNRAHEEGTVDVDDDPRTARVA